MEKTYGKRLAWRFALFGVIVALLVVSVVCFSNKLEKAFGINQSKTGISIDKINECDFSVHFIDVGQGDAVFVKLPDGTNMLCDAGPSSSEDKLIDYLNNENVSQIDYLVLTHSDEDHVGGMDKVFENYEVKNIYRPFEIATKTNTSDPIEIYSDEIEIREVDTICYATFIELAYTETCDGELSNIYVNHDGLFIHTEVSTIPFVIEFHSPILDESNLALIQGREIGIATKYYENVNSYSPIMTITYLDKTVVLAGDSTEDSEKDAISKMSEDEKKLFENTFIFKASHHGSATSNAKEFLELMSPKYVVVSCGKDNKYKHPHDEFVERLNAVWSSQNVLECAMYRTDTSGNIAFGYEVSDDLENREVFISTGGSVSVIRWWHIAIIIGVVAGIIIFASLYSKSERQRIKKAIR